MVGYNNRGVPTAADLENNSNQKKYTVNRRPGGLVIPRSLCALMVIGALLLAILVGLLVFFLVPRCSLTSPIPVTRIPDNLQIKDNIALDLYDDEITSASDALTINEMLPKSIEPTHYRIQIAPLFNESIVNGTVTITLNLKKDTYEIILHVKNIDVDKSSVKIRSAKNEEQLSVKNQNYIKGERYQIIMNEMLLKDNLYLLDINYKGSLKNHLQGFYTSYYNDLRGNQKYLASTQFSPTDARRAFPCFDEPAFKANFTLIIGRPINMSSLANMPMEKTHPDESTSEFVWDYYKTTPKISPYLLSFLVSDFQAYGSDNQIKIWTRDSQTIYARYAGDLAPQILHFLETYLNVSFPLPKIDIVGIPNFGFSAMENWGLITFRESALLYYNEADVDSKRKIATTLSHELAHQWFGNLVTPKWWNDLWLKEGLATYFQYLATDFVEPSWQIREEFIFTEISRAYAVDAFESSSSIFRNMQNNRQIRQNFNDLSYAKGGALFQMMNNFLGEEIFKKGLTTYLQKYKYNIADHSDLFDTLTKEASSKNSSTNMEVSVKEIMEPWVKQPGFPVVTAVRDVANKKLILSQKRFLFTNDNNNLTWWVPLTIISENNPNFTNNKPNVWLKNEPVTIIDLNVSSWYLINSDQAGYFIVNYDEANWRLLTENIMLLPATIRAQLISDSMDLARANLLDYDIPLKMIQRMASRDKMIMYVPTQVAFDKLEYLSDMLYSTPAFGLFETFHSTIFKRTYATVNANQDYNADIYLLQRIRKTVLKWACRKTDSECAITAHRMFRNWMEHKISIPANIWDVVYCTAIRQGSEAEWLFAYHHYLNATSEAEKIVLLDALGCTTRKWLLSRFLAYLVQNDSSIKIQDASRVFHAVCSNNIGNNMAFTFLRSHWNELLSYYGEGFGILSEMVKCLSRFMNTEYQLKELIRFRNEVRANISTTNEAFDLAIQTVRSNVKWMKNSYPSIKKWLIVHQNHFNL